MYVQLDSTSHGMPDTAGRIIWLSEPLTGGINNRHAPQYIAPEQVVSMVNANVRNPTRPKLRDGFLVLGGTEAEMQDGLDAGLLSKRISALGYLHTTTATKMLFIAITNSGAGKCYYRTNVGTGGAWAEALIGGSTSFDVNTDEARVFQASDGLIIIPDSGTNVHTMSSAGALYDGGNSLNTNPPIGCVDGCYFLDRAWLFKQGTSTTPPELHYSKVLPDPEDPTTQWNRDGASISSTIAGRLQLSPNLGGEARAVKPWNETTLMAFFDSSIEEILVEPGNPQAESIRRVIEPSWGCAGADAIVSIGQEMIFADQYGQIRSLQQTVTSAQAGVSAKPLSEPIYAEIPGKVNKQYLSKMRLEIFGEYLYVAFPRANNTEASHVAKFNLATRVWESIDQLARPVGRWLVSDIRGSGEDLWFSDAGSGGAGRDPIAKLYRLDPGTYTDDGAAIQYEEITRALDFGAPANDKLLWSLEVEALGDDQAKLQVQVSLDGEAFTTLEGLLTVVGVGGSYPLTPPDFPLTDPPSYPLTAGSVALARKKFLLSDLPNQGRCRTVSIKMRTVSDAGKQFERVNWRLVAEIQPYLEL